MPCNYCDNAFFKSCTFTAEADFGSVSTSCPLSGPTPNDLNSTVAVFPCGYAYGASPLGGDFQTENRISLFIKLRPCVIRLSETFANQSCDSTTDTGTQALVWYATIRTERRDAWGNYGISEAVDTYFELSITDSSISVTQLFQRNVGTPVSSTCGWCPRLAGTGDLRGKRCYPCGYYQVADSRCPCGSAILNNSAATDCCTSSLTDVSLIVTPAP